MVTLNEYAQFASIVYAKTPQNKLPIPTGWVEERPWQADTLLVNGVRHDYCALCDDNTG